jgi:hypothetical protein
MKHLLLFIFWISFITVPAQTGTLKIAKPKPEEKSALPDSSLHPIYELCYGYKMLRHDFQQQLNPFDHFQSGKALQLIGFGYSGQTYINRRPERFYGHAFYHQIIPQAVTINDSVHCKITGGIFSLGCGGMLENHSKNFYCGFYLGFNTGRLRLTGNEQIREKNPFFSPKLGMELKLLPGKFSISLLAEAEHDISGTSWRKTARAADRTIPVGKLNQDGITCLLTLSYHLLNYTSVDKPMVDEAQDW